MSKILIFILIVTILPVVGYAQKSGVSPLRKSALEYLYQPTSRWTGGRYNETSPKFSDRFSLSLETGVSQVWQDYGSLKSQNWGWTSSLWLGYNISPVHNIEIGGGWNKSALCDNYFTAGVSYLFNFTSYAFRAETPRRFEAFLTAGADAEFADKVGVVLNSGLRLKYNISKSVGIYVEPHISAVVNTAYGDMHNRNRIRTGANFGVTLNPTRIVNSIDSEFAVKTNLLFDALSLINVELEIPIRERFSVAGEWIFPWWVNDNGKADSERDRTQLLHANVEGKYWFGDRTKKHTMTGWFAGCYVGGGLYDFEREAEGYQGEFYVATGVSGGFAHAINKSKSLRMEYSLGMGYLVTNYRYYRSRFSDDDGQWHPVIAETAKLSWLGPTKLKASLVWFINYDKRRLRLK